jgi:hypothetical protein
LQRLQPLDQSILFSLTVGELLNLVRRGSLSPPVPAGREPHLKLIDLGFRLRDQFGRRLSSSHPPCSRRPLQPTPQAM